MGEQFEKAVSMKELCTAIRQCKRGVSHKDGPTDWYNHAYTKAKYLKDEIERGKYKLRPGAIVKIYRPKYREAIAPWFKDRVWQRSMCNNGVYHDLTAHLSYDNYACQVGKGTDLAVRRTIRALQEIYRETGTNEGWGVHLDIRKYFPSTPHAAIRALDRAVITEPGFYPFLDEIIESVADGRDPAAVASDPFGARGTGLGSQINQLHQAALLDDIDKALEEFCKHSSRYMDDFLILDKRKEICKRAEQTVTDMLAVKGLRCVNKNGMFRLKDGFYYLGLRFRLTDTGKVIVRLHPDAMRYERNALRGLKRALDAGKTDMAYIRIHYQCFIARAEYSRGDGAIHSMDKFYTELFREKPIYKRKRRYFYGRYSVRQRENPASRTGESGAPDRAEQDERDAGIRRHDGRR